ncbi:MAG: hypothetical protein P1U53_01030 [Sulfitobacter sp.]|nr:hypothetical protein [Sulfitobacter sp.]
MAVHQLRPNEGVTVDQDRLGLLYHQLGDAGAEEVVCRALEELSQRLARTERLYREGAEGALRKNTRLLMAIADQMGMAALARCARDVTLCLDQADPTALAATLSRLLRIGEQSLTAVWDFDGFST